MATCARDVLYCAGVALLLGVSPTDARPRLIVTTDIGGDPDDTQSLVRLLVHSSEFEIEGLIASASGTSGELREAVVRCDLVRELVEAYGQVQANLLLHDPGFPSASHLLECVKGGNPIRGVESIGPGQDTEGSRWIVAAVDRADPDPVKVAIWGGSTELAQALWRVRQDRTPEEVVRFLERLRVHAIGDQDDTGPWIRANFPGLFYLLDHARDGQTWNSCFRGMFLGGDETLTSREWLDTHVRTGHGPLGALYPPQTATGPNPHGALKEGDTPSWFYFLANGLQVPSEPTFGGWGGRFEPSGRFFQDAWDTVGGDTSHHATVYRWRPAFQNEFQARMDWCVRPYAEANHRPRAVLNGDDTGEALRVEAAAGSTVSLSAAGSTDPDGDALAHRWWHYREAGTYPGDVGLAGSDTAEAAVSLPADAAGRTIPLVLEVTDSGDPSLTSYRRAIITVRPVPA